MVWAGVARVTSHRDGRVSQTPCATTLTGCNNAGPKVGPRSKTEGIGDHLGKKGQHTFNSRRPEVRDILSDNYFSIRTPIIPRLAIVARSSPPPPLPPPHVWGFPHFSHPSLAPLLPSCPLTFLPSSLLPRNDSWQVFRGQFVWLERNKQECVRSTDSHPTFKFL